MEFENLKSAAKEITMPEEMKRRIAHNCKKQIVNTMEEHTMNNNCLCHLFDDNCTWIIILAIIVVFCCCCNG